MSTEETPDPGGTPAEEPDEDNGEFGDKDSEDAVDDEDNGQQVPD